MIDLNISGLNKLKKLANDLSALKANLENESAKAVESLYKNSRIIYERNIYDLVYDKYSPEWYERTYHLLGGHGALDETVVLNGANKKYEFSIDENSRDPVDGMTWKDKAEKVEKGSKMMFAPGFDRPFIDETQKELEKENAKTADEFEKKALTLIDKVVRG